MNIALNKDQEDRLQALIDSGQFDSPEAFIAYSLASLEADAEHEAWLKTEVAKGLESLKRGQTSSMSTEEIARAAQQSV